MNFKDTKNFLIRLVMQGTALYFAYACYEGYKK